MRPTQSAHPSHPSAATYSHFMVASRPRSHDTLAVFLEFSITYEVVFLQPANSVEAIRWIAGTMRQQLDQRADGNSCSGAGSLRKGEQRQLHPAVDFHLQYRGSRGRHNDTGACEAPERQADSKGHRDVGQRPNAHRAF